MPRVSKWTIGAAVTVVAALGMLFAGIATAAPVTVSVTPTGAAITLSSSSIAFGSVGLGLSADSTTGAGGSSVSTNNSIVITNVGVSSLTLVTLDYSGTPGANCGISPLDWLPISSEGSIGTDQFTMYGALTNDLAEKELIPADGSLSGLLTLSGTLDVGDTQDLDLQLFMPAAVTTGGNSCDIPITLTVSSP